LPKDFYNSSTISEIGEMNITQGTSSNYQRSYQVIWKVLIQMSLCSKWYGVLRTE